MASFSDESIRFDLLQKHAESRWGLSDEVIPLTAADPDFQVAEEIRAAIRKVADEGLFSYGGRTSKFKETISKVISRRKKIACSNEHIKVTNGVAQAMMITLKSLCKKGDEVILFDPVDFLFGKAIDSANAKKVYCKIDPLTNEFDLDGLNNLVTPKTKMICICNPHNPLGRVMTRKELKFIIDIALENDIYIMSDEIWSDIIYKGQKHVSTASLNEEAAQQTISLYGFSKTFGLAGLHLGFMVIKNEEIMSKINQSTPGYFYTVNNISMEAGMTAYKKAWYWVEAFLKHLEKVRDYGYKRLNEIPGIWCNKPEGTYTLFPNITNYNLSSEEFASYLKDKAKVAVVPGHGHPFSYFGPGAEGHIRIVFSTSLGIMSEALDRIEKALKKL